MAKLRCTASSCYMPIGDKAKKGEHQVVDRFEDADRPGQEALYEVPTAWVKTYLASGNFEEVKG